MNELKAAQAKFNATTDALIERMLSARASEVLAALSDRNDHDQRDAFLRKHEAYHAVISAAAKVPARPYAVTDGHSITLNNLGRALAEAGL
jgi:hypothetical protein